MQAHGKYEWVRLVLSLAVLEEIVAMKERVVDAPLVDKKEGTFVCHPSQARTDGALTEPTTPAWWLDVLEAE